MLLLLQFNTLADCVIVAFGKELLAETLAEAVAVHPLAEVTVTR